MEPPTKKLEGKQPMHGDKERSTAGVDAASDGVKVATKNGQAWMTLSKQENAGERRSGTRAEWGRKQDRTVRECQAAARMQ